MKRSRLVGYFTVVAGLVCGLTAKAVLTRQANTTINLPLEAFPSSGSYVVRDAWSGLTFDKPVGIAVEPGQTDRLFVVERTGRIILVSGLPRPSRSVFMDITGKVYSDYQFGFVEGLSGLAFHPNYAVNGYFYVTYTFQTNEDGVSRNYNRLSRFQRSGSNPNFGSATSELPLITQLDEGAGHNMNDLHFGPDGYLYVAIGDEGDGGTGDDFGNAQRIDRDFFSAILRIDVDKRPGSLEPNPHPAASSNYRIPPDNPYVGATSFNGRSVNPTAVRTEFFAIGFRNVWRMSFDQVTGTLYAGDVGQHGKEEINVVVKGGNYGWAYKEGTGTGPKGAPPASAGALRDPVAEYSPGRGPYEGNAVMGGVVYRGERLRDLAGSYIFADYVSGNIWALPPGGGSLRRLTGMIGIAGFGIDPRNGDVLMVDHGEGRILRLDFVTEPGNLPKTLADTGIFADLNNLTVHEGIVPYAVNAPFWSDNAKKRRWFSLPDPSLKIGFSPDGNWTFPDSTVWVKHFDLEMIKGEPSSSRRVETRVLVKNSSGVYGATYRWGSSTSNATLVPETGLDETFQINDGGVIRSQVWRYPSPNECLACHTPVAGYALGFNTPQLNRVVDHGTKQNQITALSEAGYLDTAVAEPGNLPALAGLGNTAYSREHRVRSYLAANCAQCHQPGGSGGGFWDARITTPLYSANIVQGLLANNFGNANNRVVVPRDSGHSMLLSRISEPDNRRMPPLGSSVLNEDAIQLVKEWIANDFPSSWKALAFADFNGDGSGDLLMRSNVGSLAARFLTGTNRAGSVYLRDGVALPRTWRFAGISDFNSDGWQDLIFQHQNGRCAVWEMNGATYSGSQLLRNGLAINPNWRAVGTGRFHEEGSHEIVFQHADQRIATWIFAGSTFVRSSLLNDGKAIPPEWKIAGIGDFNLDSQDDILIRHTQGRLAVWEMNGPQRAKSVFLRDGKNIPLQWRVAAVADFDRDGKMDIIWQHSDGTTAAWLMEGTTFVRAVSLGK